MRHRYDPLYYDFEIGWVGVVKYDKASRRFFRYTDYLGEHWEVL